jgi:TolB-like protein
MSVKSSCCQVACRTKNEENFARGVADEILTRLTKFVQIQVTTMTQEQEGTIVSLAITIQSWR